MDHDDEMAWRSLAGTILTAVRPTTNCGVVHCEPGWRWDAAPTDFVVWLVLSGHGTAQVDGACHRLASGTAMILRPGTTGRFEQDPAERLTVAYCHFDLLDASGEGRHPLGEKLLPAVWVDVERFPTVVTTMQRIVRLAHDEHPLSTILRSAMLLGVLLEIHRADAAASGQAIRAMDARIEAVAMSITANPSKRMSLAQAAELASLSEQHFSRLFRAETGVSFRAFQLEARMERGRQLLNESTMTVTEIARALGYPELYPFSRQIRSHYGVSPSGIRKTSGARTQIRNNLHV